MWFDLVCLVLNETIAMLAVVLERAADGLRVRSLGVNLHVWKYDLH